jgi:hypothetical protein
MCILIIIFSIWTAAIVLLYCRGFLCDFPATLLVVVMFFGLGFIADQISPDDNQYWECYSPASSPMFPFPTRVRITKQIKDKNHG